MPSGSGMATVGHLYSHPNQTSSTPALSPHASYRGTPASNPTSPPESGSKTHIRHASKDDMNVQPRQIPTETAKRYRRRSISSLEVKDYTMGSPSEASSQSAKPVTYAAMLAGPAPSPREEVRGPAIYERPASAHGRKGSHESGNSGSSGVKASSVSSKFCNHSILRHVSSSLNVVDMEYLRDHYSLSEGPNLLLRLNKPLTSPKTRSKLFLCPLGDLLKQAKD